MRTPPHVPGALLATALLLLLKPAVSFAQGIGSTERLHGYFKTIPLYFGRAVSSPVGYSFPSNGFLDYSRLRITSRSSREGGLYMNTAVEVETFAGELSGAGLIGQAVAYPKLLNLRFQMADSEHVRTDLFVDRMNLEAYIGDLTLIIGRQRIAWGSGLFWNPTDVFNPFGPLSLDPEDRTGVDGVRAGWSLGTVSSITLVHVVSDLPWYYEGYADRSATVVRAGTGIGQYDLNVMFADDRRETTLGLDASGYVGGAGVHLEVARMRSPERGLPSGPTGTAVIEWSIWTESAWGISYGLENGVTMQAEWFHNTGGATEPADYRYDRLVEGRLLAVGRDYGAMFITWPVTPLVTLNLLAMRNIGDESGAVAPGLDWSVGPNLRLQAGMQYFMGNSASEFGALPVIGYGYIKYSF